LIKYKIRLLKTKQIFDVTLEFILDDDACYLQLPTWIPGSYMIREFSKNIIKVTTNNHKQSIEQIDKNTWLLAGVVKGDVVNINYQVFANDSGIRMAYLDNNRAFINGTSLFIYPKNMLNKQYTVHFIDLEEHDKIATSLSCLDGYYSADNYYQLIDNPFEIGNLLVFDFMVNDIPHKIALSGIIISNACFDKLVQDIIKICETQINIFGNTPFNSYLFSLTLKGDIYTGLEHLQSTTLMAPYYSLPTKNKTNRKEYTKLLALISHEYFHAWNVKSIKPEVFDGYDLNNENYTGLLWFFEGLTSYYDDYVLYLSGIMNQKEYLEIVLENINNIYKYDGYKHQSLANSSLTAWIKYYRQDENSINSLTSYYILGAIFNNCIDIYLRVKSNGSISFNSVLRYIWDNRIDNKYIIKENSVFDIIYKATGIDCSFLEEYLYNTNKLPIEELFLSVGIELKSIYTNEADSKGIIIDNQAVIDKSSAKLDLGCKLNKEAIGYRIINVFDNSLAKKYAIIPHDLIIAIDNIELNNIKLQLNLYNDGDKVILTILRQGKLINLPLILEQIDLYSIYNLVIKDSNKLLLWI
jgi:predicted metalloprotease with PDZ domain